MGSMTMGQEDEPLGFKELTTDNWLERDEMTEHLVSSDWLRRGQAHVEAEWGRQILTVKLTSAAPVEIRQLHAVAQGAMLYSLFFYPLLAFASEQLFRVADAAAGERCRALGGPRELRHFRGRVEWLCSRGVIADPVCVQWVGLVELRNSSSHPEFQMILMPAHALNALTSVTHMVNGLY